MSHSRLWLIPIVFMLALVAMPLLVILLSWQSAQMDIWHHLIETGLVRLVQNTVVLIVGVGVVVMCVGVSLAWLTAVCDFPGRRWLDWALILPLAIPTYVVAFIALELMSYSGPVLTLWRSLMGDDVWYPDIRHAIGVVLVLSAVLYPYVYMLARSAFLQQGRHLSDAAQTLGLGPVKSFFRVALPVARPAIAAGMALALMEALADFGGVSAFNFDTFTTAIYKSWFGFFNLQAAAQLASLLLLFVFFALLAEQQARGKRSPSSTRYTEQQRIRLRGWQAFAATAFCVFIFTLAFVIPFVRLLLWVVQNASTVDVRFLTLVKNTFLLGLISASVVCVLALLVSFSVRFLKRPWITRVTKLTTLGYALPGSVLAVGVMISFTFVDRYVLWPAFGDGASGQILVGSVFALVSAYTIRYFSVGFGPTQTSLERIANNMQDASHSLGLDHVKTIQRVYLPLLTPGILTGFILVFVDVMKEMPATLLLRPFGWDTLAVRVYEMTSEGEWALAAFPALVLVLISIIPVVIVIRRSRTH